MNKLEQLHSVEDVINELYKRYEAAKVALSHANKLKSKEHKSRIMASMNKTRSLINKIERIKKGT